LKLLPATVEGRALRHAVEVRHASFKTPEFTALARRYNVAIVLAGDSEFPQIADLTAPFAYARIMGTTEAEETDYCAAALDTWVERARQLAAGRIPDGLESVDGSPATAVERDVFLYVISGFKPRNPAVAMALIERLGDAV